MAKIIFKFLEKAEEPEIKLPTSTGSSKKQESSRKTIYFCLIDYAKAFDCVDHNELWKILQEMGIPDHLTCLRNGTQRKKMQHTGSLKVEHPLTPLDDDERGEWKIWLKTQHSKNEDSGIQSHHLMANRWGNETVREIIFLGSKITADGDFSHEIFLKNASFLEEKLWPT